VPDTKLGATRGHLRYSRGPGKEYEYGVSDNLGQGEKTKERFFETKTRKEKKKNNPYSIRSKTSPPVKGIGGV